MVIHEVNPAWKTLELQPSEEAEKIIQPSSSSTEEKVQQGVSSIKLVMVEGGEYLLLVHKSELSEPLTLLVMAFQIALKRFGINVSRILCPAEDDTTPLMPNGIHPDLKEFATWLANPSSINWKTTTLDLSCFSSFVNEVVLHGKQLYLKAKALSSRTTMYINSIKNIIMRLFLIDRKKWVKAFWAYIPDKFRQRVTIRYHSLKKFESVLVNAELKRMPAEWNKMKEEQIALLESYNDLSGSYVEYKLHRTVTEVVKLLGKPLLKVLYDRIKIRNDIYSRMKKKVPVKLSDVFAEGLRRSEAACLPYAAVCALHRRNFYREMQSITKYPQSVSDQPEGLPFGCATLADYAKYCIKNEDLSPPSEEDSLFQALTDFESQ